MLGLPLAFAFPFVLGALVLLPVIWWLLRLTPPRPQSELFPPLAILLRLAKREETPAQSPWWLTLLRLAMATFVILAMSGPVLNPREAKLSGEGAVVVLVDNGWASAQDWEARRDAALALIDEAQEAQRPVLLVPTAAADASAIEPLDPEAARAKLASLEPAPLKPDHAFAAGQIDAIAAAGGAGSLVFLSDGLRRPGTDQLEAAVARTGAERIVVTSGADRLAALDPARNDPDAMTGTVIRANAGAPLSVTVQGHDAKGLPVASGVATFAAGEKTAEFRFEQPVELRNQIVRLSLPEARNAGAVQLLDDRFRRRLVGLVSGEAADNSQPLLSPLYYISRALSPFSDLREASSANLAASVPELIGQNVSAIVLADIGNIPQDVSERLGDWVGRGGMLIRFAGPRMATSVEADTLLPVRLREGDRNLGGALSWDEPKPVAPFEQGSPFFGLEPPSEVTVQRQVLALQDFGLEEKTWAVLDDGTPLVTAERRGEGWIVLFHTSSDASWSNLPISGTFVDMLRRVVNQARSTGVAPSAGQEARLPPMNLLNGHGELSPPGPDAEPLVLASGVTPVVSPRNPPGLYGTEDGFVSLNLFNGDEPLEPLDAASFAGGGAQVVGFAADSALNLTPWLLAAAALLMTLDCLAVLWIAGSLRPRRSLRPAGAAMILLAAAFALAPFNDARAQNAEVDFAAALTTRLAYVLTGDANIDATSKAGLEGLSRFLASRTALEPGEPVGVDVSADELAFYPFLYWPVSADADIPDAATMARVDAFMKQGGSILFDTRDQGAGVLGGTAGSPEARRLQTILSGLDIPPLEPAPADHVVTKAFYLLNSFPGRYAGGDLWVEEIGGAESADRPARAGDGVSTIMITSNDLAAAWAVDATGEPMFPTVPPDPSQREYAFRAGVNIVMYTMTGNYKADQVHIPALLERLGQ